MQHINQREANYEHVFRLFASTHANHSIKIDWCNSKVICTESYEILEGQLKSMILQGDKGGAQRKYSTF